MSQVTWGFQWVYTFWGFIYVIFYLLPAFLSPHNFFSSEDGHIYLQTFTCCM